MSRWYAGSFTGAEALRGSFRVAPVHSYCAGLLLPGERKSIEPMAALVEPGRIQAAHARIGIERDEGKRGEVMGRDLGLAQIQETSGEGGVHGEDRLHLLLDDGRGFRREKAVVHPLEERDAEPGFDLPDRGADRGLRQASIMKPVEMLFRPTPCEVVLRCVALPR